MLNIFVNIYKSRYVDIDKNGEWIEQSF